MASDVTEQEVNGGICVYLRHYPGKNEDEFNQVFGSRSVPILARVRELLAEAMKVEVDWTGLTLSDGGDVVRDVMGARHPQLSSDALAAIRRYYTYLMR